MKKEQVKVGETYIVRADGLRRAVRVLRESVWGGWDCYDSGSGRQIRIKTAARFGRSQGQPRAVGRKRETWPAMPGAGRSPSASLDGLRTGKETLR